MTKKETIQIESLTYEQAFAELERVVATLEDGQASLDESVELFQRGQALAKHCANLLEQARLKVTVLEQEPQTNGEKGD
jgi:exodeoxyribonuclease VII small subunit